MYKHNLILPPSPPFDPYITYSITPLFPSPPSPSLCLSLSLSRSLSLSLAFQAAELAHLAYLAVALGPLTCTQSSLSCSLLFSLSHLPLSLFLSHQNTFSPICLKVKPFHFINCEPKFMLSFSPTRTHNILQHTLLILSLTLANLHLHTLFFSLPLSLLSLFLFPSPTLSFSFPPKQSELSERQYSEKSARPRHNQVNPSLRSG